MGDYDSAEAQSRVLLDVDPGFWMGHLQKGLLLFAKGKPAEAVQSLEDALRLSGGAGPYAVGYFGCLLALTGDRERATKVIAPLVEASATQYVYPLAMALASYGLGNLEQAIDWFNRALDDKDVFTLSHLRYDPALAPLRRDPRMAALYARIDFK
jgi:tetratricopeptide (TPR) repeat protein